MLPAAYRDANLFGEARLKSYCGRISSASIRSAFTPLPGCFFIVSSLRARSPSGADDANELGALESGLVATLTNAMFAVVSGGLACIVVVALIAWRIPALRQYQTHPLD